MLVDLDEQQIKLIIQAVNYYIDSELYIIDEEEKQSKEYQNLNEAQLKLYSTVQRHKKR
jgi:hypothetical protein